MYLCVLRIMMKCEKTDGEDKCNILVKSERLRKQLLRLTPPLSLPYECIHASVHRLKSYM